MINKLRFTISYLGKPRWDTGISPPELMSFIKHHSPGIALDMGCGTGTNAISLAAHGWQVTGIDFIGSAIHAARRKARRAKLKIEFVQADIVQLDMINKSFDFILDIGCFHNLTPSQKLAYVDNVNRLIASQGTFLLYGFIKTQSEKNPGISVEDILHLQSCLHFNWRKDSSDHDQQPSVWLEFIKL